MRIATILTLCISLLTLRPAFGQDPSVEEEWVLSANIEQVSEMLGYLIGGKLKEPGVSFDTEAFIRGIRKSDEGDAPPMDLETYQQQIQQMQEVAMNEAAEGNLQQAEAFLKENAQHPDTVEVAAGRLQYRVLKEGNGAIVPEGGTPLVHYTGRYHDGTIFDSSVDRDPIALPLNQVIPGFAQGVAGMKEGEKRILFIHPEFGYGTSGPLQPNALLLFEVEILQADANTGDAS